MTIKELYEQKALLFSERYGICSYKINGCRMVYYENYHYPYEGNITYKHIVDLRTMEETAIELKRYYKNAVNY